MYQSNSEGRNLPGFLKKSFVLQYSGGEIWFEHLDGMYDRTNLVLEKLHGDSVIFHRPSAPSHIAFVLDETTVSDAVIAAIVDELLHTQKLFLRVALIGTNKKVQKKFKTALKEKTFALCFFDGIEPAKEWLVKEN